MARLYRPHIPLEVRCKVAARQLDFDPESVIKNKGRYRGLLNHLLLNIAILAKCRTIDLRLDHDPPLGARPKTGTGKKTVYIPDANDPYHLFYRPHGPEHEGSHLIKTNVRGDHGQHPDRVLIKKMRRIERGPRKKPKRKWASRPFQTTKGKSRWKT